MADEREMLDRWAERLPDRKVIVEFHEWLVRRVQDVDTINVFDIDIEKMVDDFHQIDPRQLEEERRALLDGISIG